MRPVQRYTAVQALAEFLAPRSEDDVDSILRITKASAVTPVGWGSLDEAGKLRKMNDLLSVQSDEVLEALMQFLPEDARIPTSPAPTDSGPAARQSDTRDGKIFVVHGHAGAIRHETVRVLERGTGREIIVLHEQVNAGRTIMEKFEDYAEQVSFAVVLLTADDEGGVRSSSDRNLRGRQNVIFELGFFFGKLGRKRVAVLIDDNVEKPSDIDGLVYMNIDQTGAWKYALARELEAAGISVNYSRIP